MNISNQIDASGLSCPIPVLKARKALAGMIFGQVLKLVATDKGSVADIPAFARQTGNVLLSAYEDNGHYVFFIQKVAFKPIDLARA